MPENATAVASMSTSPPSPDPWEQVLRLRCQLCIDLPVPNFRVNDLMGLRGQSLLNTHWRVGADVPIRVNGELIGWGEFDTVGTRLAVRLTEVAAK